MFIKVIVESDATLFCNESANLYNFIQSQGEVNFLIILDYLFLRVKHLLMSTTALNIQFIYETKTKNKLPFRDMLNCAVNDTKLNIYQKQFILVPHSSCANMSQFRLYKLKIDMFSTLRKIVKNMIISISSILCSLAMARFQHFQTNLC